MAFSAWHGVHPQDTVLVCKGVVSFLVISPFFPLPLIISVVGGGEGVRVYVIKT